jgi:hypothetical protein
VPTQIVLLIKKNEIAGREAVSSVFCVLFSDGAIAQLGEDGSRSDEG